MSRAENRLTSPLHMFCVTTVLALVRAEITSRLSPRFTGTGPQLWAAFRNELTLTDLLDLAVRDVAMIMPQPFDVRRLWPDASGDELRAVSPELVASWVDRAKSLDEQPADAYLRAQAEVLDIEPALGEGLERLPEPQAYHQILELPGSGGWLAYRMATQPGAAVYYWENFTIACGTWQEQLLAGLIAFELGAPPRRQLLIVHDPTLAQVLGDDVAFDWIIGLREENARRADALRSFLKPEGQVVLV